MADDLKAESKTNQHWNKIFTFFFFFPMSCFDNCFFPPLYLPTTSTYPSPWPWPREERAAWGLKEGCWTCKPDTWKLEEEWCTVHKGWEEPQWSTRTTVDKKGLRLLVLHFLLFLIRKSLKVVLTDRVEYTEQYFSRGMACQHLLQHIRC